MSDDPEDKEPKPLTIGDVADMLKPGEEIHIDGWIVRRFT